MVPFISLHQLGTMIGFVLILSICCALESYHQDSISSWEASQFVGYNVECILYLQEDDDLQKGNSVVEMVDLEYWVCGDMDSVNDDDARFSSVSFAEIESEYFDLQEYLSSNGATSGSSKLVLSEVVVNPKTAVLFVPKYASIKIEDVIAVRERRLAPKTGLLSTLLVRLIDSNDKTPAISSSDLYQKTFSSHGLSLGQQLNACSYGKLRIIPDKSNEDIKLAIDLKVDLAIEPGLLRLVFANKAKEILKKSYENYDDFDLINFCMPGGTSRSNGNPSWSAYAPVGGRFSAYNDEGDWCRSVSAKMHEIGHNVGLQHSPGDFTDLMSNSWDETSTGFQRMCFNSAKNFELGWYKNMQLEIDSLSDFDFVEPSFSKSYTMIGVDNYTTNGSVSDGLVVLKLGDYYVGYNAKKGINDGVKEDGDRIIIVEKDKTNGQSNKKAALGIRQNYTIQDFDQERSITIKFSESKQGIATIQIFDDENAPVNDDDDDLKGPCDPLTYFELTVEIVGDSYPEEISWVIDNDSTKERLFDEKDYTVKYKDNDCDPAPDVRTFCLAYATNFEFVISDTAGDGISGRGYGEGYYKGYGPDGVDIFVGGKLDPTGNPNYELTDTRLFVTPSPPPTLAPTKSPTAVPTSKPTAAPTDAPTPVPTTDPTDLPTNVPTNTPTNAPTDAPTNTLTSDPTNTPTNAPTGTPSNAPTNPPTNASTNAPTDAPTNVPTDAPTNTPTTALTNAPTNVPTNAPINVPTNLPTNTPTNAPTNAPTASPIIRGSCDNLPGIIKKSLTCEMLKNLENKNKKKKLCKQEAFFKGCPALCNLRCKCKDTNSKFKIMIAGKKKKRKCKNVGKTDQPNCTDPAIGGFVQDICPKTCNFCFDV